MGCAVCFFTEEYQKNIKRATFGEPRFEKKLVVYKVRFIDEVKSLQSFRSCSCDLVPKNDVYLASTDSLTAHLQNNIDKVEQSFDDLLSVYVAFVSLGSKVAGELLWDFVKNNKLTDSSESSITTAQILYRARWTEKWDESDIKQYFHIPFSLRHLVGNQRFSVSGQPMLYFASSVVAACKELDAKTDNLAFSAFVPKEEFLSGPKIFYLKNYYSDFILNSLPGLTEAGSKILFEDGSFSPSDHTIEKDIARTVLTNLCTYPVEKKGAFVAEYVIPQLLTSIIRENGYGGIVFPSTRDYSNVSGHHRFSSHHINLGVFVPYDPNNDINLSLLSKFWTYLPDSSSTILTTTDFDSEVSKIGDANKMSVNQDANFLTALPNILYKIQLEYRKTGFIDGKPYFESQEGQLELKLAMAMVDDLKLKIV